MAYRFLGNREDAEEVVQDTFLRAYRKIDSFRHHSSLSTWLYRICINLCINKKKSRHSSKLGFLKFRAAAIDNVGSASPEEDVVKNERQAQVLAAIAKLEARQAMVVTLYYLQGRPCQEIAEMMQAPANTIKTHLFRARRRLKALLADLDWKLEDSR